MRRIVESPHHGGRSISSAAHPLVPEDIAGIPEHLNDSRRTHRKMAPNVFMIYIIPVENKTR
jgi:hypothetical protein